MITGTPAGPGGQAGTHRRPRVIAHRGNSSAAPENTVAAFRSAAAAGAAMIETDLQLSADGIPVLVHDETLERTTGSVGNVADRTAAELAGEDAGRWFGPAFAGEAVPLLQDLLAFAAVEPGPEWLLEFKGEWSLAAVERTATALRDAGVAERCLLQGFSPLTVRRLQAAAPDIRRGLLIAPGAGPGAELPERARLLDFLQETGAAACNPHGGLLLSDPGLVTALHANGQLVFAWTLNNADQWAGADLHGVDGIITDRPAELAAWQGRAAEARPQI